MIGEGRSKCYELVFPADVRSSECRDRWKALPLQRARKLAVRKGWLAAQPRDFRDELLRRTAMKSYEKGEFIYHLGDPPGMMFGIVEGAALMGFPHPTIGLHQAHLGMPGDWFGEAAALHGVSRRMSVEAVAPTILLCLPLTAVQEMLEMQPKWMRNFSALLLWNLESVLRSSMDLLIAEPRARVYARLLTLCGVRDGRELPEGPITLPLNQEQLANMCGLSRKSVNLALRGLENEGACENRYGEIVVVNLAAVRTCVAKIGAGTE